MPIPPTKPLIRRCTQCSWRDTYVIRSDTVPPLGACPKCGGKTETVAASLIECALDQLARTVRR